MPHRYHSPRDNTSDSEIFARGSLHQVLGCIRNPSKGELLAKVVTELETRAEKYRQEMRKSDPDMAVLHMHERKFLSLLDKYESLDGRPYMAGRFYIDMLSRRCKRVHSAKK